MVFFDDPVGKENEPEDRESSDCGSVCGIKLVVELEELDWTLLVLIGDIEDGDPFLGGGGIGGGVLGSGWKGDDRGELNGVENEVGEPGVDGVFDDDDNFFNVVIKVLALGFDEDEDEDEDEEDNGTGIWGGLTKDDTVVVEAICGKSSLNQLTPHLLVVFD